jgi:hypothetical protein
MVDLAVSEQHLNAFRIRLRRPREGLVQSAVLLGSSIDVRPLAVSSRIAFISTSYPAAPEQMARIPTCAVRPAPRRV